MIPKFTIAFLALSFAATAQVTPTLINDLSDGNQYEGYSDMALYNNTMYISNSDAGTIFKVDVATPNAEPELVLSNLSLPTGVAVFGSDLYFFEAADAAMSANSGKLWKLDLTNAAATPVTLFSGLTFPTEIEVSGTNVYAAENFVVMGELDHGQVSLINLAGVPSKTVLYDELYSLDDIELNGTDLYLLEWKESTDLTSILKLNVAAGTPGTPTLFYADPAGYYPLKIEINNGKLYFNMDSSVSPSVLSLDLNAAIPTATMAASPFEYNGQGVYLNEIVVTPSNMLYAFATMEDDADNHYYFLYNADLSLLGTKGNALPVVAAYPNPCTDVINVSGITASASFSVYDLTGKQLMNDIVAANGTIDVSRLQTGVYMVAIEGFKAMKFVKQ